MSQMREKFKMSDLDILNYYVRIEVRQNEDVITMCQDAYAEKILEPLGWKTTTHVTLQ